MSVNRCSDCSALVCFANLTYCESSVVHCSLTVTSLCIHHEWGKISLQKRWEKENGCCLFGMKMKPCRTAGWMVIWKRRVERWKQRQERKTMCDKGAAGDVLSRWEQELGVKPPRRSSTTGAWGRRPETTHSIPTSRILEIASSSRNEWVCWWFCSSGMWYFHFWVWLSGKIIKWRLRNNLSFCGRGNNSSPNKLHWLLYFISQVKAFSGLENLKCLTTGEL